MNTDTQMFRFSSTSLDRSVLIRFWVLFRSSLRLSTPGDSSERRRRGRPRLGEEPTHHVLRVCVLEDSQSNVLSRDGDYNTCGSVWSPCRRRSRTDGLFCFSGAEVVHTGAPLSSWPAGGRLPGPAEVRLPSAGRRRQTSGPVQVGPEPEAAAAPSGDADAGRDLQNHEAHQGRQDAPLHPTEGTTESSDPSEHLVYIPDNNSKTYELTGLKPTECIYFFIKRHVNKLFQSGEEEEEEEEELHLQQRDDEAAAVQIKTDDGLDSR